MICTGCKKQLESDNGVVVHVRGQDITVRVWLVTTWTSMFCLVPANVFLLLDTAASVIAHKTKRTVA